MARRVFSAASALLGLFLLIFAISYALTVSKAYLGVTVLAEGDPEFRQTTDVSCGPAALRYILAHEFGVSVSEEEIARLAGTGETGTTLAGLRQAAQALGFAATSWRWPKQNLGELPLPAVAYMHRTQHYVVLTEVRPDFVEVFDPAQGAYVQFTWHSFAYFWSGVVMVLDRPQGS